MKHVAKVVFGPEGPLVQETHQQRLLQSFARDVDAFMRLSTNKTMQQYNGKDELQINGNEIKDDYAMTYFFN